MRAAPATQPAADRPFRKRPGQEPLPGYRLIEPLGRGGFGEVWKCEAPGGLHKAIKFVADPNNPDDADGEASLRQEFEAFEAIKRIRHPFLLTLERVELLPGDLVMVMELADHQLQDHYARYAAAGEQGIPRDELLGYLADAAEVLDHLGAKHGLQHLDIKPANLFIVCERVKVGDFGLVRKHELTTAAPGADRGLTPKYVAPEILHGRVDPRSDQYCLALVYQEMLTGRFPYPAKTPQQMMLQHVSAAPDLSSLPESDRAAVAKALSKAPTDRFASCLDFVRALMTGAATTETWTQAGPVAQSRPGFRSAPTPTPDLRTRPTPHPDARPPMGGLDPSQLSGAGGLDPVQLTGRMTRPNLAMGRTAPRLTTPGQRPGLTTPGHRSGSHAYAHNPRAADEAADLVGLTAVAPPKFQVRLPRIWSVVPVNRLTTHNDGPVTAPDAGALVEALVSGLCPDGRAPTAADGPTRHPDGAWRVRVPVRPIPGTAAIRLAVLRDAWSAEVEQLGADKFAVRRPHAAGGLWGRMSGKKAGLELLVDLPPAGTLVGEATLTGRIFGQPDATLVRAAETLLPEMLAEARGALQNADDRRATVRIPTTTRVTLYPVHGDGAVDAPLDARCRDVSGGGLCCESRLTPDTAYVYAVFPDVPALAPWAVLVRLTRATADTTCHVLAGRFRVDL